MAARVITCALCGKRKSTDFHHILNKAKVPSHLTDWIPVEFMTMLCHQCNLNQSIELPGYQNKVFADSTDGREYLLAKQVKHYGVVHMQQVAYAWNELMLKHRMSVMYWLLEAIDKAEKELDNV